MISFDIIEHNAIRFVSINDLFDTKGKIDRLYNCPMYI